MFNLLDHIITSLNTSPCISLLRLIRGVLFDHPIIINPTTISVSLHPTRSLKAGVLITDPVAHLDPISSLCKLSNRFCMDAQADA